MNKLIFRCTLDIEVERMMKMDQSEIISRENEDEGSVEPVWGCFAVKSKREIRRKLERYVG